jgi:hypothetical protein
MRRTIGCLCVSIFSLALTGLLDLEQTTRTITMISPHRLTIENVRENQNRLSGYDFDLTMTKK